MERISVGLFRFVRKNVYIYHKSKIGKTRNAHPLPRHRRRRNPLFAGAQDFTADYHDPIPRGGKRTVKIACTEKDNLPHPPDAHFPRCFGRQKKVTAHAFNIISSSTHGVFFTTSLLFRSQSTAFRPDYSTLPSPECQLSRPNVVASSSFYTFPFRFGNSSTLPLFFQHTSSVRSQSSGDFLFGSEAGNCQKCHDGTLHSKEKIS